MTHWKNLGMTRRTQSALALALLALGLAPVAVSQTAVIGLAPVALAKFDATAQSANVGTTTLYTVPSTGAGAYRLSCYIVVTRAATTSSTLPACQVVWTDNDSNTVAFVSAMSTPSTGNTVGANGGANGAGQVVFNARASTAIQISTAQYASVGGTSMQFAVHYKLEYLGL